MGIVFIIFGIILMAYAKIHRVQRVVKTKSKLFEGYTTDEAVIQWIGIGLITLGIIISLSI